MLVFLAFALVRGLRCTPAGGVEYRFGRRIGSWEEVGTRSDALLAEGTVL